ncbi:MAG: hypothetical protein HRU69_02170 [Flammeovirgaceae bacterium]|nr:MAG: hypothetical protein HRU69_02170 [Flammeovirgaceae bacterium]
MKYIKFLSITALLLIATVACKDESKLPFDYEKLEYGAYATVIEVPSGSFLAQDAPGYPLNPAVSRFTIVLEVRDAKKGGLLEEMEFAVKFKDNNAPILEPAETSVATVPASAFTKDPDTGYPRATITIESATILTALGLTATDVNGGDVFEIRHILRLKDGREFTNTNTNGVVTGGAFFNAPMFSTVSVLCPSDLEGNYNAVTDWVDYYGAPDVNAYTVNLTAASGIGQYNLDDLSGGMEPIIWGNPPVPAVFEDVCGKLNLVSAPYIYGYLMNGPANTFGNDSNVNPGTGVITIFWENVFAEYGRTVLTPI